MKLLYIILITVITTSAAFTQTHPNKEVNRLLNEGLDNIVNQNYAKAQKQFYELDKKYPELPLGKIFLAVNSIFREYELSLPFSERQIVNWLDEGIKKSDALIKQDENNVWNNYYKGLAEGYRAYFYALNESWVNAFTKGLSAKKYFDRCLELNSNFYDAYVAIGAYKFWKSEKTEIISWIVKDERAEGIKNLNFAITNSSIHSFFAVHNLVWIQVRKKDFQSALGVLNEPLKKHPESRLFKWDYSRVMEELDRNKAIEIYKDLLKSYKKESLQNRCNEITLNYLIAKNYKALNQLAKAVEYLKLIPEKQTLTGFEVDKLGSRISRIESLKNECGL